MFDVVTEGRVWTRRPESGEKEGGLTSNDRFSRPTREVRVKNFLYGENIM